MDNKLFPERLDRNKVYECGIFSLYTDKVKLPSGYIIEKYHQIHHHHEGVSIVVFNDKDEILMIREMRYTVGHLEWEIPAGGVEDGESIEEAVRREVMEETGCTVKNLKFLCSQNPSNGMSDQVMHVFGAKVDSEGRINDTDEVADKVWMPIAEVKELLRNNQTKDSIAILAILYALTFYHES